MSNLQYAAIHESVHAIDPRWNREVPSEQVILTCKILTRALEGKVVFDRYTVVNTLRVVFVKSKSKATQKAIQKALNRLDDFARSEEDGYCLCRANTNRGKLCNRRAKKGRSQCALHIRKKPVY